MFSPKLYFLDYIQINNDIWFASTDYNGLYRYNLEEKIAERVASFYHEPFFQNGLFCKMCQYYNNIIFVPQNSKRIYIFNVDNREMIDIVLPKSKGGLEGEYFYEAVVYEKYIYMMGVGYPGILKLNLENYEISILEKCIKELCGERQEIKTGFLGIDGVQVKDKFFIPCYQNNKILEFDMHTEEYCFFEIGNKKNKYAGMIKVGNEFVLVTYNEKKSCCVVFWNPVNGECEEIRFNMAIYNDTKLIEYMGDILVFSVGSFEICRLDRQKKRITHYMVPGLDKVAFMFARVIKKRLFLSDYYSRCWYTINDLGQIEKVGDGIKECLGYDEIKRRLLFERLPNKRMKECELYSLEIWIEKIIKEDTSVVNSSRRDFVGEKVYTFLRRN